MHAQFLRRNPNAYLHASTHPRTFTLALGLQAFQNTHRTQWTYLMAAATVFTLPVILLFAFGQRYFTQGIPITGIKG